MRVALLLILTLAACNGPRPAPAVTEPAGGDVAPRVTIGGDVTGLYGTAR